MSHTCRVTTSDELLAMPDDGHRYELVEGELRMMSPAGGRHGRIAAKLARRLGDHVEQHGLGETFAAETGFLLRRDPDTVRAPGCGLRRVRKSWGSLRQSSRVSTAGPRPRRRSRLADRPFFGGGGKGARLACRRCSRGFSGRPADPNRTSLSVGRGNPRSPSREGGPEPRSRRVRIGRY